MATNINLEKLNNPELIEKLKKIEDPEAFRAAVEAEGIDLDDALKAIAAELPGNDEGELSDADLESVAGGGLLSIIVGGAKMLVSGAVCLKRNMRKDGSMRKCECGLHKYAVRKGK